MAGVAVGSPVMDKIQSLMNDASYTEITRNTAKYNSNICRDRHYRQPYIDGQTGIAQRNCNLFISDKQRMPGILQGQVYTYPSRRWRSTHRSYLASFMQATRTEPEEHTITTVENPVAIVTHTVAVIEEAVVPIDKPIKTSHHAEGLRRGLNQHMCSKSPAPSPPKKEPWMYYEENTYEEEIDEEFESDEDFDDETYSRKGNKRKKTPGRKPKAKPKKKVVLKAPARLIKAIKKDENDTENKPYVCALCGMRYKTRPGLTYHYAHSHREEEEDDEKPKPVSATPKVIPVHHVVTVDQVKPLEPVPPYTSMAASPTPPTNSWPDSNGIGGRTNKRATTVSVKENSPIIPSVANMVANEDSPQSEQALAQDKIDIGKKRVPASPYCDFCLGDSSENKKTGQSEQLVSCADCGRSGHPSCLQFTDNMMKSVLRYRWQCIECKTCTLCGTSENDDQLLFCDDCDRGYHLYCLSPPLSEPPEGEWSCNLCIKEFHNND